MAKDWGGSSPGAPPDEALAWIESYWDELAAFTWRSYVAEGRGIVLLQGDWQGEVAVGYQTPSMAERSGFEWPVELLATMRDYVPATEIVFLVPHDGSGTLLRLRSAPPRPPPREAGQRDGSPPLVPSA